MMAGFLTALRELVPTASLTCCVPFALAPLQRRFPEVTWLPYDEESRIRSITNCELWLGLGGSPFQNAQSRWFIDHLTADAAWCARQDKPMFFLGVGVQTAEELAEPAVQRVCAQAAGIWTRDPLSAERLRALTRNPQVEAASDLAHLFFRARRPPPAQAGRLTLVPNFDYGSWPGQDACLAAVAALPLTERVWLAQESRVLPGAERALYATLPAATKAQWQLVSPDAPDDTLAAILTRWPSGEWLVTARYHAALAGAWSGSKTVVIATNEKLRAAARDLACPTLSLNADLRAVTRALEAASSASPPAALAAKAEEACTAFVRAAGYSPLLRRRVELS